MVSVFQWPLKNLEVIFFYQDMSFYIDVKQICRTYFAQCCYMRNILSQSDADKLVHAICYYQDVIKSP